MNREGDFARTALILSVGRLAANVATFAAIPIYTLFLTPAKYGLLDVLITYISLSVPVLTLRLEAAVFRFLTGQRAAGTAIPQMRVLATALVAVSPVLGLALLLLCFLGLILAKPSLALLGAIIVTAGYTAIIQEFARGSGSSAVFTITGVVLGIFTLGSTVLTVCVFRFGVTGALVALLSANLAALAFVSWKTRASTSLRAHPDRALARSMLHYSLPLVPTSICWWATNAAARTIVILALGAAANGVFGISNKFGSILMIIFPVFGMALTESAILHIGDPDADGLFSRIFTRLVAISLSLASAVMAGTAVLLPKITAAEYQNATLYVPIIVLTGVLNNIYGLYSAVYAALNKTNRIMELAAVAACLSVGISVCLIVPLGLWGASLGGLAGYGTIAILAHRDVRRNIRIVYRVRTLIAPLGVLMAVAGLYYLRNPTINLVSLLFALAAAAVTNRGAITSVLGGRARD
jgi:O-antigen/teichoic acid export membrane protein